MKHGSNTDKKKGIQFFLLFLSVLNPCFIRGSFFWSLRLFITADPWLFVLMVEHELDGIHQRPGEVLGGLTTVGGIAGEVLHGLGALGGGRWAAVEGQV